MGRGAVGWAGGGDGGWAARRDALLAGATHPADDVAALERALLESACVTPLWFQTKALLVQPGVQGLVFRPFGPVLDLTWTTKQ